MYICDKIHTELRMDWPLSFSFIFLLIHHLIKGMEKHLLRAYGQYMRGLSHSPTEITPVKSMKWGYGTYQLCLNERESERFSYSKTSLT